MNARPVMGDAFVLARLVLAALVVAPSSGVAQELAARVAEVEDGAVRFSFATRPDVLICDRGIRMGDDDQLRWRGWSGEGGDTHCRPGPAEVEVRVREGRVRAVEVLRRGTDGSEGARRLGTVSPGEAVGFLASTAVQVRGSAAEDAVFPMVLADVERVWERLLEIARNREAPGGARKSALFWLGQEAAEAATAGLVAVAEADDEEQEVRDAAVFALSQRPGEESVPVLMELARTAKQAETRRKALFWLAQSDAPEVVAFFEEILRSGAGG